MRTGRAYPRLICIRIVGIDNIWMCLCHVLLKPALLNERLLTPRLGARIVLYPGVLLQMIEHCVLAVRNLVTIRADELTNLILRVRQFCLIHTFAQVEGRGGSSFSPGGEPGE